LDALALFAVAAGRVGLELATNPVQLQALRRGAGVVAGVETPLLVELQKLNAFVPMVTGITDIPSLEMNRIP
jgi:hypothetical protein